MATSVPTALDQLLLKLIAVAGAPVPSRPYLNFLTGATFADNPTFTVNGEQVGSTDLTISVPGAALNGVVYVVNGGSSPTLSATVQCASVDTDSGGAVPTVYLPTSPTPGMFAAVFDSDSNASVNNITVSTHSGATIQNPYSGGFGSTITLSTNNVGVIWAFDPSYGGAGEWQAVSVIPAFSPGGDLGGSITSQTVLGITGTGTNSYTGTGTVASVQSTETVLASTSNVKVTSVMADETQAGASAMSTVLNIPVTSGSSRVSVSLVGVDAASATGVYSADLATTAISSGGSLSLISPSPATPVNEVKNGTLAAASSQLIKSGNNVAVQVNVASGITVHWSVIVQIQSRT